ncbi:MAG: hypothetical protein H0U60_19960 [Blastocatellia bacterium]|nr:hypothetical protein [Blastocatellia bacterium]
MIIEVAVMASAVALLNAVREAMGGSWKPLIWTVSSGVIAGLMAGLVSLSGVELTGETAQILTNPVLAFTLGIGGSGVYTLTTKASSSPVPEVG